MRWMRSGTSTRPHQPDRSSSKFEDDERFTHLWLTDMPEFAGRMLGTDDIPAIVQLMQRRSYAAGYVVITRGEKEHLTLNGISPEGALDRLEEGLSRSALFELVFANPDARVFALTGTG
jgi:hypothetical protein